jgi:hypothetical protein
MARSAVLVFSAFSGGIKSGLLSHAIACLYFASYYSLPGRLFHWILFGNSLLSP